MSPDGLISGPPGFTPLVVVDVVRFVVEVVWRAAALTEVEAVPGGAVLVGPVCFPSDELHAARASAGTTAAMPSSVDGRIGRNVRSVCEAAASREVSGR